MNGWILFISKDFILIKFFITLKCKLQNYRMRIISIYSFLIILVIFLNFYKDEGKGFLAFVGGCYSLYTVYGFLWDKDMFWLGSIPYNNENLWLRYIIFFGMFVYIFGVLSLTYKLVMKDF